MSTALYRHWNEAGRLLYVGISSNHFRRVGEHEALSHWFGEVSNITIEHFADRDEAVEAERSAILAERPIFNIAHNREASTVATFEECRDWMRRIDAMGGLYSSLPL